MKTIIIHSDKGEMLAKQLVDRGLKASVVRSPKEYQKLWAENTALIFIGALGLCVREISHLLQHKAIDPAVVNMDTEGRFVQPVVSGHIGGANKLATELAGLTGALPVITTVSDTSNLWGLDNLAKQFNWKIDNNNNFTSLQASFVNCEKTALLLEVRDEGTLYMETTSPSHVDIFYKAEDIKPEEYKVILAVTPYLHNFGDHAVFYRPPVMHLGLGAQRYINSGEFTEDVEKAVRQKQISPLSIASLSTHEMKKDEAAFQRLSKKWNIPLYSYNAATLSNYTVSNPSEKVEKITGNPGVCEAAAMHAAQNVLYCNKTKRQINDKYYTFAASMDSTNERKGFVEFIGAGPGNPDLISVRGKKLLQTADFILYAGSLVPEELTHIAKKGCVVESSAGMDLQSQIDRMTSFYDRGLFIARLHTGDPCVYGAVQEQMAKLDKLGMDYAITPGISSFQAAASALKSQLTIPEEVQTIILTRGEGRTPVPEREQLDKLAASQSTMCIYLSASIAKKIQQQLEAHYPPDTPVAVCYKLTWNDERIYRCTLETLADTVQKNNITMTTLIVVGKAIDNRLGNSKLYDKGFSHAYRKH